MKQSEAKNLKKGDLVIISAKQNTIYRGLVLEIENVCHNPNYGSGLVATMKQPGYDNGFRIVNYDVRRISRFEPV